jgi:hypothetical protein
VSTFSHPCDALDELVVKLNEIPGVEVNPGGGIEYSIRRLRSLYDHERDQLPVKAGDRVRINKGVTYGTTDLIVAKREGVVEYVDWNSYWKCWQAMVEMTALYRLPYNGELREQPTPGIFTFLPEQVTVIGVNSVKTSGE